MIWWLAFEKKPFQFWREIWTQVVNWGRSYLITAVSRKESEALNCQGTKSSKCWGLLPKIQLFHNWGLKSAVLIEGRLLFKSKGQSVLVKKHDFSWKRVLLDLALSLIRTDCMLRLSHVHKGLRDSLRVVYLFIARDNKVCKKQKDQTRFVYGLQKLGKVQ